MLDKETVQAAPVTTGASFSLIPNNVGQSSSLITTVRTGDQQAQALLQSNFCDKKYNDSELSESTANTGGYKTKRNLTELLPGSCRPETKWPLDNVDIALKRKSW